jgi:hypothetical protein
MQTKAIFRRGAFIDTLDQLSTEDREDREVQVGDFVLNNAFVRFG